MLKVKGVYCYKHKEEEYIHDGSFEEVVNYLLYKKNVITRYDDDSHGWMAEIIDYADVENEITIKLPDILSSNPLPNRGG